MANKKITDLTELTTPASGDFFAIVDVSDTTDDAAGTSKKIKRSFLSTAFYLSSYTTFKDAIDVVEAAGGGELVLDGGTWEFSESDRELPSDIVMRCVEATTVKVPDGVSSDISLFRIDNKENISIIDPGHLLTLDGNRANRAEDTSENGMNIRINGGVNIFIEVGLCQNAHGDGVYIGANHTEGQDYSENITIPFIDCYNSYRNGISIISAKNLTGGTWILRGSDGIAEDGLRFEPNYDYNAYQNIYIENVFAYGNDGCGVMLTANNIALTTNGEITIKNIVAHTNDLAGVKFASSFSNKVHIEVNKILSYSNQQQGVYFRGAEQNCHIGTIWAINNGKDGGAVSADDSAVVMIHVGGTLDADNCVIDKIVAYDNQDTQTQQYAFFTNGTCTSSTVYIGEIIDLGNVKSTDNADVNLVIGNTGWIPAGGTWVYASATEITVPAGGNHIYGAGDKVKIYNESWKYFDVVSCTDTVLTISGGTTYTLTNAAISGQRYSHQSSPFGYPSAGL